jgi:hypothetical protein
MPSVVFVDAVAFGKIRRDIYLNKHARASNRDGRNYSGESILKYPRIGRHEMAKVDFYKTSS